MAQIIVRQFAGRNTPSIGWFLCTLIRGRDRIEEAIDAQLQLR
jgi:hypothetical protein